jgi:phosphohistidine phosphatase
MKKLLLLRHAKSNKHESGVADFDRPLNNRGTKAASLVGNYMAKKKIRPDLAISSPAERARQTAVLALKAAGITTDLRFDERIYEASASILLNVVKQIDDSSNLALLVGHNPGFEDLLADLSGHVQHMPTAALAYLVLDVEKWNDSRELCAELKWMVTPKGLEQE